MTIRSKLNVGFAILFSIALILGVTAFISISGISRLSEDLHNLQHETSEIESVLSAHYTWRQGLIESVLFGTEFKGSLDPNGCALGKWRNEQEHDETDTEIIQLLHQVEEPHKLMHNQAEQIINLIKAGNREEAQALLSSTILPKANETINTIQSMTEYYNGLVDEKMAEISTAQNWASVLIAAMLLLACILSFVLASKIINSIMNPLKMVTDAAKTISIGDVDIDLSYSVKDEIGVLVESMQELAHSSKNQAEISKAIADGNLALDVEIRSEKDILNLSIHKMLGDLNQIFRDIRQAALQVADGSQHMADGSQILAQGSVEQSAAIEQLNASIGQITERTEENAVMARQAAELADSIKENAVKGTSQMEQMVEAVNEINNASSSIEKVIKVIDDIAFQTNILALNAAIEAASAGQHGKGFAVVADEVRNLAAKSAEAAKETRGLISNSIEKAYQGSQIASDTSASLKEIADGIMQSTAIIDEIANSSADQTSAFQQISIGIDQVSQVVKQNSSTAEESAAAAQQLSSQSVLLQQLISQFRTKDEAEIPYEIYE